MKNFILPVLLFIAFPLFGQHIEILNRQPTISFRGLSVVNDKVVWVSGSNGKIGRSIDGGKSWKWMTVKGFEKTDFRDIEAFSSATAVIMGIAEPAYILRTVDGGDNWTKVYENNTPGIFLDAMEFWNDQSGIAIGDPINKRIFITRTFDGGKTWQEIPEKNRPLADSGEACFASSGTNIALLTKDEAVFISGGLAAHFFIRNQKIKLPIIHGTSTTGANSIAVKNQKVMVVVGGDFMAKNDTIRNCVITKDGGATWNFPTNPPSGYRSCVEYLQKKEWITCGLNGVDISDDDGMNWRRISDQSFHVVRKAKKGNSVYFAGNNGVVGRLKRN